MAPTSRWALDYSLQASSVASSSAFKLTDPPGYVPTLTASDSSKNASSVIKHADLSALRQQKAWELALAPAKSVPMQAVMMYMTGGGVQIFSVMSVWNCLKGAFTGIMGIEKAFEQFTTKTTTNSPDNATFLLQKLTFFACQIALLAVGLWKMNQLGLLPTHESDWLAWRPMPVWSEVTSVSLGLQPIVQVS